MNGKEIAQLAEELSKDFKGQGDADKLSLSILNQTHVVEMQKDPLRKTKPVGTGYGALLTKQNYAYLSTIPFVRFNAPTDTLAQQAEEMEVINEGMWKLSGAIEAYLRAILDLAWSGRGWVEGYAVPKTWSGLNFSHLDSESDEEYLTRVRELKLRNFPIIVRHIDNVQATWPTYDIRGGVDQVVSVGQMTVRQIKNEYEEIPTSISAKKDTERITIVSYTDKEKLITVATEKSGVVGNVVNAFTGGGTDILQDWEHGMGMNPRVLLQTVPLPSNPDGYKWAGAIFDHRHLIPALDGAYSDWGHNIKRAVHALKIFSLNLAERQQADPKAKQAELIPWTPDGDVVLNAGGSGQNAEAVNLLGADRTNPDLPGFMQMGIGFAHESGIRRTLLGLLEQGGDSGVRYNTGSALAQKQFGPTIEMLKPAAEGITARLLAAVPAVSKAYPDIPDAIPISFVDSKNVAHNIEVKPKDVKGWETRLQGRIELGIPINEDAMIQTARLFSDPQNGIGSVETALERWCGIESPRAEMMRRRKEILVRALDANLLAFIQQRGMTLQAQPGNATELAQRFAGLQPEVQEALRQYAASQGQQLPGPPEARGVSNKLREGTPQAITSMPNLEAMPRG